MVLYLTLKSSFASLMKHFEAPSTGETSNSRPAEGDMSKRCRSWLNVEPFALRVLFVEARVEWGYLRVLMIEGIDSLVEGGKLPLDEHERLSIGLCKTSRSAASHAFCEDHQFG